MKIHYSSSLYCKGKGLWGFPQRVNWQFEHGRARRFIPSIYRFSKGIVFDIITLLDEAKLREFFEKYEATEEKMTPLQRRCAEQENPYQTVPIKEIWINGKKVTGGYSSSSVVSIPWAGEGDNLMFVKKAYSSILKGTASFGCERFCIPYPEADSKIQKILRLLRLYKVKNIKLSTYPMQWFYPLDISFEMSGKDNQKVVHFKHPVTGAIHMLYFQNAKPVEIPLSPHKNCSLYVMQSMYEIEPALPEGDTLEFNNSIQHIEPPGDRFSPTSASSIGIIGGADGPTSIFISNGGGGKNTPRGLHGLPLHNCFSVPSFEKTDVFRFVIEGINIKKCDSREYYFK